jgi:hypothetical protein
VKINFNKDSIMGENFAQQICAAVLNYYIELEKQIIEDNKNNTKIIKSSQKTLKHLQDSKNYIESYYKINGVPVKI